jgi:hypothetical protein
VARLRSIEILLAADAAFELLHASAEQRRIVGQCHVGCAQGCLRLRQLRLVARQRGADVAVVERRDHRVRVHALSFVDENVDDTRGDFCRYRCLAPRNYVAGSIEHRIVIRAAASHGGRGRKLDDYAAAALMRPQEARDEAGNNQDRDASVQQAAAPARCHGGRRVSALEPQLIQ